MALSFLQVFWLSSPLYPPEQLNLGRNMFPSKDITKTDYISLNIQESATFTRGTSRSLWRVRLSLIVFTIFGISLIHVCSVKCKLLCFKRTSNQPLSLLLIAMESVVKVSKKHPLFHSRYNYINYILLVTR